MILNRILFTITKRFVNQMSRKAVENVISSPELQLIKKIERPTVQNTQSVPPIPYIPNNFVYLQYPFPRDVKHRF